MWTHAHTRHTVISRSFFNAEARQARTSQRKLRIDQSNIGTIRGSKKHCVCTRSSLCAILSRTAVQLLQANTPESPLSCKPSHTVAWRKLCGTHPFTDSGSVAPRSTLSTFTSNERKHSEALSSLLSRFSRNELGAACEARETVTDQESVPNRDLSSMHAQFSTQHSPLALSWSLSELRDAVELVRDTDDGAP